jgi:streptogramin lyase
MMGAMREMTLICTKCGASLQVQPDEEVIVCRYCGTSVRRSIDAKASPVVAGARPGGALLYAAIGIPAVVLGVLALVVLLRQKESAPASASPGDPLNAPTSLTPSASKGAASVAPAAASASANPEPALADLSFAFGEKGSGPGQLDDARAIAVDPTGNVFVADYQSRRVQRFDASGKFVAAFRVEEGTQSSLIHGLATTYEGHLWVSRGGDLVELAMPDGKVVRTLPNRQPKLSYGGIAVDQTNTIYASNFGASTYVSLNGQSPQSDDIRKLDKNGNLLVAWKDIMRSSHGADLAVDGAGTLYVSEAHSPYVDVVDSHGKVKERLRPKNHTGGGLAVDGKGRIFYATARGTGVCDGTGSALGTIGALSITGVAIGPKNVLYTVSREGRVEAWTLR